jgi:hypothetical protein
MAKSPALTKALLDARQWKWLTQEDRSHLDRWLEEASDPVWDELAGAITAFGWFSNTVGGPLSLVIHQAVLSRGIAAKDSRFDPKQELKKEERVRQDLLTLAEKMEDVVQSYLACKIAHEKHPPPPDADKHPAVLAREESLAWLQKDAQRIRKRAAKQPEDPSEDFFGVRLRRQSSGQRRSGLRAIAIFVHHTVFLMRESTGKPRWPAVAALTNVAFPSADVDAEDVRSMCKPSTRAGRRKKPGHSGDRTRQKTR